MFKPHWLNLFEQYEAASVDLRRSLVKSLKDEEVDHLVNHELYNKRTLSETTKELRTKLQERILRKESEEQKHKLAKIQAEGIHDELSKDFPDMEYYWKNIRDLRDKQKYRRAGELLKKRGRKVGQVLYDYTSLPTNLFSVRALINISNGRAKDNTAEHFMSLHSNAGPSMLEEAISIGIKYDIPDYALAVYKNIHTVITTKSENILLQKYHTNNKMITPQISYDAVGMTILVDIPKPITRTKLAWQYFFKTLDIKVQNTHPFTNVLPLDRVVEQYLDIDVEKLKAILKLT